MDHLTILADFFKDHLIASQVVIVCVYAILAKAFDILISRVLKRLTAAGQQGADEELLSTIHTPVYWTVFSLGLMHAMILSPPPEPWSSIAFRSLQSIIMLIWLVAANRALDLLFRQQNFKDMAQRHISSDLYDLNRKLLGVTVIILGFFWMLTIWGVNLTPLFASAGIAGIAVALAAKDTLANFFGGLSIFLDKIYKVGDYIVLETGERGEVMEVGMRSTRIKTRDDVMISVPNSMLATTKVINESAPEPRFRIRVPVGVAYGSDVDQVEDLLLGCANVNQRVVHDPDPRVRMRAFGNSSVDFELLCWVGEPAQRGLVTHELLKEIYKCFAQHDVTIPFPQMDVHMKSNQD